MLNAKLKKTRYALLLALIFTYLFLSFVIRLVLFIQSWNELDHNLWHGLRIFGTGFLYDFGVAIYFVAFYALYLLLIPKKWIGLKFDRFLTYLIAGLLLFIMIFGSIGEIPFWEEFNNRYNFIAVDYLIYTYEVVQNINESYPIPLIIVIILGIIAFFFFTYKKRKVFYYTFHSVMNFPQRLMITLSVFLLSVLFTSFLKNNQAEWSDNTYENELSKNGIYSLFAAYISNELNYGKFYKTLPDSTVYPLVRKQLQQTNSQFTNSNALNINRSIQGNSEQKPNIVLIAVESLSGNFLSHFGNKQNLTPFLDQIADEGIFFDNLYATGTRTVRGMEALVLSVPPTPGNSIVRRPNNENLFSIATILKQKGYELTFLYGGDGYFDNMNYFFSNEGFNIIDRDRGNVLPESLPTHRTSIPDSEVRFENAWGICDQDIYAQALKNADEEFKKNQPFFTFIMTTSNHRPYTFPEGSIDAPQHKRKSAVQYTDFAIKEFIEKAKGKDWYNNTVFVVVADHCASSAGKWELNIEKHHIPAIIYNLPHAPEKIHTLSSQIDVVPTLFGYLGWSYESELYGLDVNKIASNTARAFIGNYRTLGLLKNDTLSQLNNKKEENQFIWNSQSNDLKPITKSNIQLQNTTISFYQTASERFKNGQMKVKNGS